MEEELNKKTIAELKTLLANHGISVAGLNKKQEFIDRAIEKIPKKLSWFEDWAKKKRIYNSLMDGLKEEEFDLVLDENNFEKDKTQRIHLKEELRKKGFFFAQQLAKMQIRDERNTSATDDVILKNAFAAPYIDPKQVLQNLMNHLQKCIDQWQDNSKDYYSPYSTLFGSSGYGKSRLVHELSGRWRTAIICLRSSSSSGYPPRTPELPEIIQAIASKVNTAAPDAAEQVALEEMRHFLACIVEACMKYETIEKWNTSENKWVEIDALYRSTPRRSLRSATSQLKENVILVFDEARELLQLKLKQPPNMFRVLRKALIDVSRAPLHCLLLDTVSYLSNFTPPVNYDDSLRVRESLDRNLFPPFFQLSTFDTLAPAHYFMEETHTQWFKELGARRDGNIEELKILFALGRPLWGSLLHAKESIEEVIAMAQTKLIGAAKRPIFPEGLEAALTLISCRVGLSFSPQAYGNSKMVASHMATCLYISEARDQLMIHYPSEPILSEAAARELAKDNMLQNALQHLECALKSGLVQKGPRGELVARLLLMMAWDRCCKSFYTRSCTVRTFLQVLVGDGVEKIEEFPDELADGLISFTHFVGLEGGATPKTLDALLLRCAAASLKPNQKGADIMIPVVLTTGERSCILIQTKNYGINTTEKEEAKGYKLTPEYALGWSDWELPYVALYMQLGKLGDASPGPWRINFKRGSRMALYGCSKEAYPFLENQTEELLQRLLIAAPDPLSLCKPDSLTASYIKSVSPLVYQ